MTPSCDYCTRPAIREVRTDGTTFYFCGNHFNDIESKLSDTDSVIVLYPYIETTSCTPEEAKELLGITVPDNDNETTHILSKAEMKVEAGKAADWMETRVKLLLNRLFYEMGYNKDLDDSDRVVIVEYLNSSIDIKEEWETFNEEA